MRRVVEGSLIHAGGEALKLKPKKKRPASREIKRIYTDEAIAAFRPVWDFFRYKRGKSLASSNGRCLRKGEETPGWKARTNPLGSLKSRVPAVRAGEGGRCPASGGPARTGFSPPPPSLWFGFAFIPW